MNELHRRRHRTKWSSGSLSKSVWRRLFLPFETHQTFSAVPKHHLIPHQCFLPFSLGSNLACLLPHRPENTHCTVVPDDVCVHRLDPRGSGIWAGKLREQEKQNEKWRKHGGCEAQWEQYRQQKGRKGVKKTSKVIQMHQWTNICLVTSFPILYKSNVYMSTHNCI